MSDMTPHHIPQRPHVPVLMKEVLTYLSPTESETYVDGTFGAGGYSKAILESADSCQVIALDRDLEAMKRGDEISEKYGARFRLVHARFSELLDVLNGRQVSGLVLDLGVSSPQLDQAERGFSFQKDGPLDMRMGLSDLTAADVVNTYEEEELANIFYLYGEERFSRRVARLIVERRSTTLFTRTCDLAFVVAKAIPQKRSDLKIHPATRVFQALRIYVNEELREIEDVLEASHEALLPGGRLVVVSFHSLEDRLVKLFLKKESGQTTSVSRYVPDSGEKSCARYKVLTKKAVIADEEEVAQNPRSRSARLRAAYKIINENREGSLL